VSSLNIQRQRWLDRVLGAPVCWLVTLLHRLRGPETVPGDMQRILIIVLSEMGALVLTRPMFQRLRQNHPSATFYLLCSEQNDAVLDLLDEVPAERVITIRSGSLTALATDSVRAVRRMRALPHLAVECAVILASAGLAACATAGSSQDSPIDAPVSHAVDGAPATDAATSSETCTTTQTCQAAVILGTVSGDSGSQMVTTSGYQAAWVKVRVTEDNGSIGGQKLKVTATLTSPAAAAFDVLVYVNPDNDVIECASPTGTPTTNGNVETLSVKWGEGAVGNSDDDSRTVAIEVRPKSTSCSPAQTWQLVVKGD